MTVLEVQLGAGERTPEMSARKHREWAILEEARQRPGSQNPRGSFRKEPLPAHTFFLAHAPPPA